jgi:hypothetical protein
MRDFSLLFGACCVLTFGDPLCFVYALDCHRAARESCCDALAAVMAAPLMGVPLTRMCAWTTRACSHPRLLRSDELWPSLICVRP